jgi:hypothetical protein
MTAANMMVKANLNANDLKATMPISAPMIAAAQPAQEHQTIELGERCVAHHREDDRADGTHRARLGRSGQAHHDGAQHQEDQDRGRDDAPRALDQERLAEQRPRHRRKGGRLDQRQIVGIGGKQRDLQK